MLHDIVEATRGGGEGESLHCMQLFTILLKKAKRESLPNVPQMSVRGTKLYLDVRYLPSGRTNMQHGHTERAICALRIYFNRTSTTPHSFSEVCELFG